MSKSAKRILWLVVGAVIVAVVGYFGNLIMERRSLINNLTQEQRTEAIQTVGALQKQLASMRYDAGQYRQNELQAAAKVFVANFEQNTYKSPALSKGLEDDLGVLNEQLKQYQTINANLRNTLTESLEKVLASNEKKVAAVLTNLKESTSVPK